MFIHFCYWDHIARVLLCAHVKVRFLVPSLDLLGFHRYHHSSLVDETDSGASSADINSHVVSLRCHLEVGLLRRGSCRFCGYKNRRQTEQRILDIGYKSSAETLEETRGGWIQNRRRWSRLLWNFIPSRGCPAGKLTGHGDERGSFGGLVPRVYTSVSNISLLRLFRLPKYEIHSKLPHLQGASLIRASQQL